MTNPEVIGPENFQLQAVSAEMRGALNTLLLGLRKV